MTARRIITAHTRAQAAQIAEVSAMELMESMVARSRQAQAAVMSDSGKKEEIRGAITVPAHPMRVVTIMVVMIEEKDVMITPSQATNSSMARIARVMGMVRAA